MQADRGYSAIKKTLDKDANMLLKIQAGNWRKCPHWLFLTKSYFGPNLVNSGCLGEITLSLWVSSALVMFLLQQNNLIFLKVL